MAFSWTRHPYRPTEVGRHGRQTWRRQTVRERRPFAEFHRERAPVGSGFSRTLFEPVNVRDVRMVQGRENFGFALESREAIGIT